MTVNKTDEDMSMTAGLIFFIVLLSFFEWAIWYHIPKEEPILHYFLMVCAGAFLVISIFGLVFTLLQKYREKERNSPPFKRYKASYFLWKYGGIGGFLFVNPISFFIMIYVSVQYRNGYAFLLLVMGLILLSISMGCVDEDMKRCKKCKVLYGNKPCYCGKCGKALQKLLDD